MSEQNMTHPNTPEYQEQILSAYIEVWKTTVGTQQHFNDLELRIRNLAITVLGAILSGAALTLKDRVSVGIYGRPVLVAVPLVMVGMMIWLVFYGVDRYWYHPLLIGSVVFGLDTERRLRQLGVHVALTQTIGDFSPLRFKKTQIPSPNKMDWFYFLVVSTLLLLIGFLTGSTTVQIVVVVLSVAIVVSLLIWARRPLAKQTPNLDTTTN
jgi:hypothetical protein